MPVHQGHRGAGADAAQVGVGFAALRPVRAVHALIPAFAGALIVGTADFGRVGVRIDADLVGLIEDHIAKIRRTRQFHIEFADDIHRRWQIEVGAPNVRTRDDHLLYGAAFFVLILFVVVIGFRR